MSLLATMNNPSSVLFEGPEDGIWGTSRGTRPKAAAGVVSHLRDWEDAHHPGSESEEWSEYALCECCGAVYRDLAPLNLDDLPWFPHWCCLEFTKSSIQRVVLSQHWHRHSGYCDYNTWVLVFQLGPGQGWGLLCVENDSDDWDDDWHWRSAALGSTDDLLRELSSLAQEMGEEVNPLLLLAALGEEE